MATKKTTVEKVIQQAMPGWKIVKRRPLPDNREGVSANVKADAISPGLAAQQAKISRGINAPIKKSGARKKAVAHAEFVTITPASQPDSIRKFQKVVLVKGGKIVAQQG